MSNLHTVGITLKLLNKVGCSAKSVIHNTWCGWQKSTQYYLKMTDQSEMSGTSRHFRNFRRNLRNFRKIVRNFRKIVRNFRTIWLGSKINKSSYILSILNCCTLEHMVLSNVFKHKSSKINNKFKVITTQNTKFKSILNLKSLKNDR